MGKRYVNPSRATLPPTKRADFSSQSSCPLPFAVPTCIFTILPLCCCVQTNMKDVIYLRDAIVSSGSNMHQPMDLQKRMKSLNRNEDVNKALMMMLSVQASLGESRRKKLVSP